MGAIKRRAAAQGVPVELSQQLANTLDSLQALCRLLPTEPCSQVVGAVSETKPATNVGMQQQQPHMHLPQQQPSHSPVPCMPASAAMDAASTAAAAAAATPVPEMPPATANVASDSLLAAPGGDGGGSMGGRLAEIPTTLAPRGGHQQHESLSGHPPITPPAAAAASPQSANGLVIVSGARNDDDDEEELCEDSGVQDMDVQDVLSLLPRCQRQDVINRARQRNKELFGTTRAEERDLQVERGRSPGPRRPFAGSASC